MNFLNKFYHVPTKKDSAIFHSFAFFSINLEQNFEFWTILFNSSKEFISGVFFLTV